MIVNKYRFSKELIKEYVWNFWRTHVIVECGIFLAFLLYYLYLFLAGYQWALWVILMVCSIPVMLVVRIRRDNKLIMERNVALYGKEDPEHIIEIGEEILYSVEGVSLRISPKDVKKCKQTKNLIIFKFKGNMAVMLKKDSFVQGSAEECLAWFKKNKQK